MARIENWSICCFPDADPYGAPESLMSHLNGRVIGHPKISDGMVLTSSIVFFDWDLRKAKTKTGTEYDLGDPSPAFLKFLKETGRTLSDYNRRD